MPSNMRLGLRHCGRIRRCLDQGACRVGTGPVDGCASLTIPATCWAEVRQSDAAAAPSGFGPDAMTAAAALGNGPRWRPAKVLNRDDIGALKPGMAADIVGCFKPLDGPSCRARLHESGGPALGCFLHARRCRLQHHQRKGGARRPCPGPPSDLRVVIRSPQPRLPQQLALASGTCRATSAQRRHQSFLAGLALGVEIQRRLDVESMVRHQRAGLVGPSPDLAGPPERPCDSSDEHTASRAARTEYSNVITDPASHHPPRTKCPFSNLGCPTTVGQQQRENRTAAAGASCSAHATARLRFLPSDAFRSTRYRRFGLGDKLAAPRPTSIYEESGRACKRTAKVKSVTC